MPIQIAKITHNKKRFLDLLLLADEQESMIDKYLEQGDMFVLSDGDVKSVCVAVKIDESICELKNLATSPKCQGQGYGRALIRFLFDHYRSGFKSMLVGTGESPGIISFYEHCGFRISHRVKNFFTDNYDHPIFEDGVQLVDMVYLKKDFD